MESGGGGDLLKVLFGQLVGLILGRTTHVHGFFACALCCNLCIRG